MAGYRFELVAKLLQIPDRQGAIQMFDISEVGALKILISIHR